MYLTKENETLIEVTWLFHDIIDCNEEIEYMGTETLELICKISHDFEEKYKYTAWNIPGAPLYIEELQKFAMEQIMKYYNIKKWGATEACPHCGHENFFIFYNPEKERKWKKKCMSCGREIMLCDGCLHSEDNQAQHCDWCETPYGGKCWRGETRKITIDNITINETACDGYSGRRILIEDNKTLNKIADEICEAKGKQPLFDDSKECNLDDWYNFYLVCDLFGVQNMVFEYGLSGEYCGEIALDLDTCYLAFKKVLDFFGGWEEYVKATD